MTGADRRAIAIFALVSAVGGPPLGVALFWWLPLALAAAAQRHLDDLWFASLWMLTTGALLLPANAPPAALAGGLGTWLLLRARARGSRRLRGLGAAWGAGAGTALALLAIARGEPYGANGGGLALLLGALQPGPGWTAAIDLAGNLAAGAGTGVLLGWFVAARVAKGT